MELLLWDTSFSCRTLSDKSEVSDLTGREVVRALPKN